MSFLDLDLTRNLDRFLFAVLRFRVNSPARSCSSSLAKVAAREKDQDQE
jgi:hypothetical protein